MTNLTETFRRRLRPILLVVPALWLFACGPDDEQAQAPPPQPVPVGVIEAQLSPVNLGDSFVGRIEAIQKVEVRARVTGFIEARLFEEGQMVEAGASLFRIEKAIYETVVQQREADLAAAEAEAVNARAQLARAETLVGRGNNARSTEIGRASCGERGWEDV